jgi:hypothetical protein
MVEEVVSWERIRCVSELEQREHDERKETL